MPVTLLVKVKQQLGVLVPGWVTIWHVLYLVLFLFVSSCPFFLINYAVLQAPYFNNFILETIFLKENI